MSFADQLLQALSRTFIHSLWQGLILSVVAGLIILCTTKTASSLRYILLTISFFVFIPVVSVSFFYEWNAVAAGQDMLDASGPSAVMTAIIQQEWMQEMFAGISALLKDHASWIVFAWSLVVLIKSGKMMLDLFYVSRLRSQRTQSPAERWKTRLAELTEDMGVKRVVAMVESGMVRVPMILGHLKPVILMPFGILNNMSDAEVEAVLLHELAHIRRNDYLVNFIQRITECLFFFNPALLWVSGLMRIERENCCDDMAIARTDNRLQFAEALISFKKHSMRSDTYMLGFAGRKNVLLQRMTRIVYRRNSTLSLFESVFFVLNAGLLAVLLLSATNHQDSVPPANISMEEKTLASILIAEVEQSRDTIALTGKRIAPVRTRAKAGMKDNHATNETVTDLLKEHTEMEAAGHSMAGDEGADERISDPLSAEQQRHLAAVARTEAQIQREQAEINRAIAAKHRADAEVFRAQAAKAREAAEMHRKEAEIKRAEAEVHRREADEHRKMQEEYRRQRQEEKSSDLSATRTNI